MEWDRVGGRRCSSRAAAVVAVVVLSGPGLALAEPAAPSRQTQTVLELRNLMTQSEYRAAGLGKLSAQELAVLDGWVGRLMVRLLKDRKQAGCSSPVDSRIDGEFQGWTGRTVFELENGQIWRQLGSRSQYAYKVSPRVQIHRSASGCALKVDGVEGELLVERLK